MSDIAGPSARSTIAYGVPPFGRTFRANDPTERLRQATVRYNILAASDTSPHGRGPEPDGFTVPSGPFATWEHFLDATGDVFSAAAHREGWDLVTQVIITWSAWEAYQKSFLSPDLLVIGAFPDIRVIRDYPAEWPGHQVLSQHPWSWEVNDAWIQGGIDRQAVFYLGSNWDRNMGQQVFQRELHQLWLAGYGQEGDYLRAMPGKPTS